MSFGVVGGAPDLKVEDHGCSKKPQVQAAFSGANVEIMGMAEVIAAAAGFEPGPQNLRM